MTGRCALFKYVCTWDEKGRTTEKKGENGAVGKQKESGYIALSENTYTLYGVSYMYSRHPGRKQDDKTGDF